jgi:hypothetical protein
VDAANFQETTMTRAEQFHEAMVGIWREAKKKTGYNAKAFLEHVIEDGGLPFAQRLLRTPDAQTGFTELWMRGRLDLTMEHLVLRPEWRELFTEAELQTARERLIAHGFTTA